MKIVYDTEFIDTGRVIDLVSIGAVREDGVEYYAVSNEFDRAAMRASDWMMANVWPHLPLIDWSTQPRPLAAEHFSLAVGVELDIAHPDVKDRATIADELLRFLTVDGTDGSPEVWAWYDAHDFIALTQLWGPLNQLPKMLPKYGRDLKQEYDRQGLTWKPPDEPDAHDALADARWNVKMARLLGIFR